MPVKHQYNRKYLPIFALEVVKKLVANLLIARENRHSVLETLYLFSLVVSKKGADLRQLPNFEVLLYLILYSIPSERVRASLQVRNQVHQDTLHRAPGRLDSRVKSEWNRYHPNHATPSHA